MLKGGDTRGAPITEEWIGTLLWRNELERVMTGARNDEELVEEG